MAKGKRSNSPKRSRRGGKRSPKKSKMGVQQKISKAEYEPAHLHKPTDVEEPDCECDMPNEEEGLQQLPKSPNKVPVGDVSTVKADLVQFFWESLEEDTHAGLKILSQLDENLFFFGKVAAEIAKTGKFTEQVENNLGMVWKADEAWVRSFLAGEVEPAKPEEPEAPEEPAEILEEVEAEVEPEATIEAEVAAEVAADAPAVAPEAEVVEAADIAIEEKPEVDDAAMEDVVEEPAVEAKENLGVEGMPESMEEIVSESAFNKENSANVIAEAVKTISTKMGEQSVEPAAVEGLVPKDLNVVA